MSIDPVWLFVSLFPSGIGLVLFVYGKKQGRGPHLVAGLLLMVYPYFATTLMMLVTVGVGLVAALWLTVRAGW